VVIVLLLESVEIVIAIYVVYQPYPVV